MTRPAFRRQDAWDAPDRPASNALDRRDPRFPVLATVEEVATWLRTTRKAVYAMIERRQLPGVTRIGRRVLVRTDDLLDWLDQKRALSLKENRR